MDKLAKFLRKLDRKRWNAVLGKMDCIHANTLAGLDIVPLSGQPGHFRCRIGDMRILFYKTSNGNVVYDADFRGNIYKK